MKSLSHHEILQELSGLLTGHWLTDLANTSALLFQHISDINWVGFYLFEKMGDTNMWLGPFQGLPACTMIPFGKGVCGKAALEKKSLLIDDVNQFAGHIVCDARSQAEVVVPLIIKGKVIGVLDVDSATRSRFSESDQSFLEAITQTLLTANQNYCEGFTN